MQQIIVYAIGLAALAYVAVRVVRIFTRRPDPCAGCSGCPLHDAMKDAGPYNVAQSRGVARNIRHRRKELSRKRAACRRDGVDTGCGCGK